MKEMWFLHYVIDVQLQVELLSEIKHEGSQEITVTKNMATLLIENQTNKICY